MTPRGTAGESAGTHSAPTTAPHPWRPLVPEHGERVRCSVCGSENRWSTTHRIPSPRAAEEETTT